MKLLKYILPLLLIVSSIACRRDTDIKLRQAEPSLVVEATLTDSLMPYTIKLTTTKDYFSGDPAPAVNDAFVTISDNAGNKDTLYHTVSGLYKTKLVKQGIPGRTYTLNILYKGRSYEAVSTMLNKMELDSVRWTYVAGNTFQPKGYYLTLYGQDPPEKGNYFWFKTFRNDSMQFQPVKYLVDGDQFINGNYIKSQIPYLFNLGDSGRVEFYSIGKDYYEYLFALNQQLQRGGSPFDAQPANLPTNIKGGALGYFEAAGLAVYRFKIK